MNHRRVNSLQPLFVSIFLLLNVSLKKNQHLWTFRDLLIFLVLWNPNPNLYSEVNLTEFNWTCALSFSLTFKTHLLQWKTWLNVSLLKEGDWVKDHVLVSERPMFNPRHLQVFLGEDPSLKLYVWQKELDFVRSIVYYWHLSNNIGELLIIIVFLIIFFQTINSQLFLHHVDFQISENLAPPSSPLFL